MRYPLQRLQVIKGRTLSRSTFDCRGVVDFSAAFFALADAFRVTADFGGLPFLRFGGGGGAVVATAEAGEDSVVGGAIAGTEAFFVTPLTTTTGEFVRTVLSPPSVAVAI